METAQADLLLRRIGARRPARPTAGALRELHLRHLVEVPFENLSVHLGEEIVLEEGRLWEKVAGARRGGFCYELNGLFGALLRSLGYEVELLAARTYGDGGRLGIPYDHMALRVRTEDGGDLLADIGFGAHSHHPLDLGERGDQHEPGGVFRVTGAGPAPGGRDTAGGSAGPGDLDVLRDGTPVYRLETTPRALSDFVTGAWWHSTSPRSRFVTSPVCSRLTEDGGRVTLRGRRLVVTAADGHREERDLATDEEVLTVYRERFGIVLDRVPDVSGV
ncbi:arylamine N-acetyltransferase [Streptomyces sp. SID8352]|uniref:arylamine N-acetyltransferase family protein n=1 Tax=Streptomyces sp. SID8352 TaxID=2690338 RepID=UPI00136CF6F6|nr:arylamine N-acetyltransferase [Streptomyces sp. SID8352]MYU21012.1 arylamine N-acetyltransferase [Streptomyces sp. SID8352]